MKFADLARVVGAVLLLVTPMSCVSANEMQVAPESQGFPPRLIAPKNMAVMHNVGTDGNDEITWEFKWDKVTGANAYRLRIFGPETADPLKDVTLQTTNYVWTCRQAIGVAGSNAGLDGWTWSVTAMVNGEWGNSSTREFRVAAPEVDRAPKTAAAHSYGGSSYGGLSPIGNGGEYSGPSPKTPYVDKFGPLIIPVPGGQIDQNGRFTPTSAPAIPGYGVPSVPTPQPRFPQNNVPPIAGRSNSRPGYGVPSIPGYASPGGSLSGMSGWH